MSAFRRAAELSNPLRDAYLASLPEPQEWFLEELVLSGEVWECPGSYAVFHDDTLVEFFAADETERKLSDLRRERPFKSALSTSFDVPFLTAATRLGGTAVATGYLFRKRVPVQRSIPEGFRLSRAVSRDLDAATALGTGFFASRQEVDRLFRAGSLWIGWHNAERVGCGVTQELSGAHGAVDVGMVVRADQRSKGYGTALVASLSDSVERAGMRPVCGCAQDNLASKAALEAAGFVTEHRLLRIKF